MLEFLSSFDPQKIANVIEFVALLVIARTLYDTYRATRSAAYFEIVKSLNTRENVREIQELKTFLNPKQDNQEAIGIDPKVELAEIRRLGNSISNRYQVVAHMVERNFLDKPLFIENFSGTTMDVWDTCAPFILEKRMESHNHNYLRADLERLALQSWIYQAKIVGFHRELYIFSSATEKLSRHAPTIHGLKLAKQRIAELKRNPLLWTKLKMWFMLG